jgi:hypothetical protein
MAKRERHDGCPSLLHVEDPCDCSSPSCSSSASVPPRRASVAAERESPAATAASLRRRPAGSARPPGPRASRRARHHPLRDGSRHPGTMRLRQVRARGVAMGHTPSRPIDGARARTTAASARGLVWRSPDPQAPTPLDRSSVQLNRGTYEFLPLPETPSYEEDMSSRARTAVRRIMLIPLLLLLASFSHAATACGAGDATGPCCKVCKEGKACGDTCIAKTDVCHVGAGCACQG